MLSNIPPTTDITKIKDFKPSKKRINGTEQVIMKAYIFLRPKSNIKTFFNVRPRAIKEVNVVKTPKNNPRETIPSPKKLLSPVKADPVVWEPVIPKINKMKKR